MRVIAGSYRSRPLVAPQGQQTRPTSDRLRETLFNILAPRMPGSRFADLYAGTGAVGIEALSRGADYVLFVEDAAPALNAIRSNLQKLGVTQGFSIEARRATAAIDRLLDRLHTRIAERGLAERDNGASFAEGFDFVFLDPPYEAGAEYSSTLGLLGSARARLLLAQEALVVVEHSSKLPLADRYGFLNRTRILKQGEASLSFYSYARPSFEEVAAIQDGQSR